jgi:hypothetical protein
MKDAKARQIANGNSDKYDKLEKDTEKRLKNIEKRLDKLEKSN